ncbi:MAG: VanZ like protein [uncultured bacterium]|nr:MAG: VanZ like protein [uncultured bacterium]
MRYKDKMKYIRFFPAGIYNGIIWFLSSGPVLVDITGFDKTAHIIEYSVLGLLLAFAFNLSKNNFDQFARYSIVLGLTMGAIDEIHQYFVPGRSMDVIDLFADMTGIAAGILAWVLLVKILEILKFKVAGFPS